MDGPEKEMAKKADQYAKRLLVRNKDLDQSFEPTRSFRRRKKIMDAIGKKGMTSAAAAAAEKASNEPQLVDWDEEQEKPCTSTWLEGIVDRLDDTRQSRGFNQQSRDLVEWPAPAHSSEMRTGRPAGRRKTKQEPQLLSPRVLRVLEPQVVYVERSVNRSVLPSALHEPADETAEADSTFVSLVSREASAEQEYPSLYSSLHPSRYPKLYPSLSSMTRRMSERPGSTLRGESARTAGERRAAALGRDLALTGAERSAAATRTSDETVFATPMAEWRHPDGASVASALLGEARAPRARGKPDLESTRQQSVQPWASQQGTSISTLTVSNTPSDPADQPGACDASPPIRSSPCWQRHDESSLRVLLDLLEVHQTQIYQASKALELCRATREFAVSGERVEAERLLLAANLGKLAVRERIRGEALAPAPCRERAELTVAELSVPLREQPRRRAARAAAGAEWFVLAVSEGLRVWTTPAVARPPDGPRLHFPGRLALPELAPDFRLRVGVYSMRLRPGAALSHEEKYRIGRRRGWPCPAPRLPRLSRAPAARSPRRKLADCSGFRLRASLELRLEQLRAPGPAWPLRLLDEEPSPLRPSLSAELRCRLRLAVRHAGFLTHGVERGGAVDWSRRWCVLEGRSLRFWNYPREQEDERPPLLAIDLLGCLSPRVALAERRMCARPRTLLLETARRCRLAEGAPEDGPRPQRSGAVVRSLLSCDSQHDLVEWQSRLNHVVCALRQWKLAAESKAAPPGDL